MHFNKNSNLDNNQEPNQNPYNSNQGFSTPNSDNDTRLGANYNQNQLSNSNQNTGQDPSQYKNYYTDEYGKNQEITPEPEKKKSGIFGILGFFFRIILIIIFLFLLFGIVLAVLYFTNNREFNGLLDRFEIPTFNSQQAQRDGEPETIIRETTALRIINEDSEIIETVKKTDESVVSVVLSRNVSDINNSFGLDLQNTENIPTQVGAGTGFIVSENGYIITNRHVVEAENVDYTVVFSDGQTVSAEVLDKDTVLDIAVLKIEPGERTLKSLVIGDSSSVQVGQSVLAIGNSLGSFGNSVSRGIVSGLDRTVVASDGRGGRSEVLDNVIQTDASINPGNSGGPLLDVLGNVIGVNVARAEADNIAFAIPINDVKVVLDSVIKNGEIQRPFLGINFRELTPEETLQNNLGKGQGIVITSDRTQSAVVPGSSAEKAGLKQNDIILEINDQKVDAKNTLSKQIQKFKVGDKINLKILRDKNQQTVEITLGKLPKN